MEDEIYIDFPRCFKEILRNWYWLVLTAVLFAGITFAVFSNESIKYYAQATLYSSVYGSTKESVQQADYLSTYTELIYTEKVCERARVLLGNTSLTASDIQNMIKVSADSDSVIIRINAYSYNPDTAIAVANAVAQSFTIEAKSITGDSTLQTLDEATAAYLSGSPVWRKYCAIAFLVGIFIPAIIIAIREIFSDSIYRVEDAGLKKELEIIGIIPNEKDM